MITTCIAISNMSGIVCASDANHTIYQLSRRQPLAIAVNPHSPIPWDNIIHGYKEKGEIEAKENFEECALNFLDHLYSYEVEDSWKNLSLNDGNIIFMGYGKEDMFPCLYDVILQYNSETSKLEAHNTYTQIAHNQRSAINLLGNLDSVSTLIWGANAATNQYLLKKHMELFEIYKQRVIERFKGTKAEDFVIRKLEAYDPERAFDGIINQSMDETYNEVAMGIDTFSIEDMVSAAETIINAEVRLDHLISGCKEPLHRTQEIAVITRTEGLTWIKHSLYAI
jgi:hypothetical protein